MVMVNVRAVISPLGIVKIVAFLFVAMNAIGQASFQDGKVDLAVVIATESKYGNMSEWRVALRDSLNMIDIGEDKIRIALLSMTKNGSIVQELTGDKKKLDETLENMDLSFVRFNRYDIAFKNIRTKVFEKSGNRDKAVITLKNAHAAYRKRATEEAKSLTKMGIEMYVIQGSDDGAADVPEYGAKETVGDPDDPMEFVLEPEKLLAKLFSSVKNKSPNEQSMKGQETENQDGGKKAASFPVWAIVLIVGLIVLLIVLMVALVVIRKKRAKSAAKSKSEMEKRKKSPPAAEEKAKAKKAAPMIPVSKTPSGRVKKSAHSEQPPPTTEPKTKEKEKSIGMPPPSQKKSMVKSVPPVSPAVQKKSLAPPPPMTGPKKEEKKKSIAMTPPEQKKSIGLSPAAPKKSLAKAAPPRGRKKSPPSLSPPSASEPTKSKTLQLQQMPPGRKPPKPVPAPSKSSRSMKSKKEGMTGIRANGYKRPNVPGSSADQASLKLQQLGV